VAKAPNATGIKPAKTGTELKPVVPIAIKTNENGNKILTPIVPAPDKTTPPLLRVNGIAYQNNSAESMAIINGNPLSKGSTIEGTTIEEIHKDKVVFQHNGRKFEIHLGQTNR
jgi:type II secretory pathway component PulC